jgi:hypothetical protein
VSGLGWAVKEKEEAGSTFCTALQELHLIFTNHIEISVLSFQFSDVARVASIPRQIST